MKKPPKLQIDIFDRDPQQDLFARRAAQPGLDLFADTLKGAADKLKSDVRAIEAAHKSRAASGPFAVVFSPRSGVLRAKPNPFENSALLRAELDRVGARIWEDGYRDLDSAEQGAGIAKSHNGARAKYTRIYDQSTGEPARRARGRLPPFTKSERWENTLTAGYVEIAPAPDGMRALKDDSGYRWSEPASENEGRRRQMFKQGFMRVTGETRRAPSSSPEELVVAAIRRLTKRTGSHEAIQLAALRELVPLDRRTVDGVLLELHHAGRIVLSRNDNTAKITPHDQVAALYVGGHARHLLYPLW